MSDSVADKSDEQKSLNEQLMNIINLGKEDSSKEVGELIRAGADVDHISSGKDADTPLNAAISLRNKAVVQLLLDVGADINKKDGDGFKPIDIAILSQEPNFLKLLIESGADIEERANNSHKSKPLDLAVKTENTDMMEILLAAGADVSKDDFSVTHPSPAGKLIKRAKNNIRPSPESVGLKLPEKDRPANQADRLGERTGRKIT